MWLKVGNQRVHSSGTKWIIFNPASGAYSVHYRVGKVIYRYERFGRTEFSYRQARAIAAMVAA